MVMPEQKLIIRAETTEDYQTVRSVNEIAFGRKDEAGLVDSLRADDAVLVSLVAESEKQIVGHILFSRMSIEAANRSVSAVALAPVAVLPQHQRKGIGEAMIRRGLDLLRDRGEQIVIVLGHPDYYPRFGFSCEKAQSLASPFPKEAYMAMELVPRALDGVQGRVDILRHLDCECRTGMSLASAMSSAVKRSVWESTRVNTCVRQEAASTGVMLLNEMATAMGLVTRHLFRSASRFTPRQISPGSASAVRQVSRSPPHEKPTCASF